MAPMAGSQEEAIGHMGDQRLLNTLCTSMNKYDDVASLVLYF